MRIFVSWSGEISKAVARVLHAYLPRIIQAIDPWMSEKDLEAGHRWSQEIGERLQECDVGICVVSKDNAQRPWLNFEAGAISKSMKRGRLIPFMFDIKPSDLSSPISQFQARDCSEAGVRDLLRDLNALLPERPLEAAQLEDTFGRFWPSIAGEFEKVRTDPSLLPKAAPAPRSEREVLEEILTLVRGIQSGPRLVPGGASSLVSGSVGGFGSGGFGSAPFGGGMPSGSGALPGGSTGGGGDHGQ